MAGMITVIHCIGGWLVAYHESGEWVSAITSPESLTGCVWMIPGWER